MRPVHRLLTSLDRRPWVAVVGLAVLAALVLLVRLGTPGDIIFDEVYYVTDARAFLEHGVDDGFAVHPPMGKWGIAGSIALLGDDPTGWRAAGALAGLVTVLLTFGLARRLLATSRHRTGLALLPPLLLLFDGLFIVQSRTAMLDVFLLLWSTLALWLLVVDRQRRWSESPPPPARPSLRTVAGIALGLAVATKWSGLLTLGAAGLLTIGWELAAARRAGEATGARWLLGVPRRAAAVVGSLVLVPAVVYVAAWVPWMAGFEHSYTATTTECGEAGDATACEFTVGDRVAGLLTHHRSMTRFHLNLEATHSYRGDPLGFVVLQRPVVYHWETCPPGRAAGTPTEDPDTGDLVVPDPCVVPPGDAQELLAVGNPALWWGFLLLTPLLVAGVVRRDRRSAVVLVGWLALWTPWLLVSRTAFLFYLVPAVPLLALGVAVALARVGDGARLRATYGGALAGAGLGALAGGAWQLLVAPEDWRLTALLAGAGWLVGAAALARRDEPTPVDPDGPGPRPRPRRWTVPLAATTVLTVAFGLFVWFWPVWLAWPMSEEAVRLRWWFRSWI